MQPQSTPISSVQEDLLAVAEQLLLVPDPDTILDGILDCSRRICRAEAGTIFLKKGDKLLFSYVHNDVLFASRKSRQYLYQDYSVEIDDGSLAGFVANHGETLVIDDAYNIDPDAPYGYNRSFDEASGYRCKSFLITPIRTRAGNIVGVLELINAKDYDGHTASFSPQCRQQVEFFCKSAAAALEKALTTRELLLRQIRMVRLRDPKETGSHVTRVGGYAAEIFEHLALKRGMDRQEIRRQKGIIRIAAMMHDIGKVAISDTILKKPGRLTPAEFHIIKFHTISGAQLFEDAGTEVDIAAREVALHHHERWDGKGYPGKVKNLYSSQAEPGAGLKEKQIPLFARITALADVFDALISIRVYKDAWPIQKALDEIDSVRGTQFDPEVVEAFFDVFEVIDTIRKRYPERI